MIRGDRVEAAGRPGAAGGPPVQVRDLGQVTLAPGFVDVHAHGGGGASFCDDPAAVLAAHRARGTTTMVASLVTGELPVLAEQVRRLGELVARGELAGVHLEGPWLSPGRAGAHPPRLLRDPDPQEVRALAGAGGGAVRMVTLAAERPGGLESVRELAGLGVIAALGHSEASHEAATAAIAAGITGATHLFNAMPPLHHREPGPLPALLADGRVWLELIADGVHLHPAVLAWVMTAYPQRAVLVSDAMAAAGAGDGDYLLGQLPVRVSGGVARVAGTSTIAGSTLTLDQAVRTALAAGVPLEVALRAASANPAGYLGLERVGRLAPGYRADAVVLGEDATLRGVLHRGQWLNPPEAPGGP